MGPVRPFWPQALPAVGALLLLSCSDTVGDRGGFVILGSLNKSIDILSIVLDSLKLSKNPKIVRGSEMTQVAATSSPIHLP